MDSRAKDRIALALLFGVYLFVLAWIVLFKLHLPFIGRDDMRSIKLVPFFPVEGFGWNSPLELGGNLVLFVPLGVFLATLTRWKVWQRLVLITAVSLALEILQFVLAAGNSDTSDLIVNTAGGALGIFLVSRIRRRLGERAVGFITSAVAIVTLLALIAVGIQISRFPHLEPPRDGHVIIVDE